MDLALDPLTHDLAFDETGDAYLITGVPAIAQHVRIRLRFIKGEWYLDQREGTPYVEEIWGQVTEEDRVTAVVRAVLLGTPGIRTIDRISVVFTSDRVAEVSFAADTDEGVLDSADYPPFIVEIA